MSVDDQLFKEDGTLLTKVDIVILKAARSVAATLYAEDDDETFDRALRRMIKTASVIMITSGLARLGVSIFTSDDLFFALLQAGMAAFLAALYWSFAFVARCNGRGSTIDQWRKGLALFFLSWPIAITLLDISIFLGVGSLGALVGNLLFNFAFGHYVFASDYVQRLQAKPPKKKRARAFKFAFDFNR